MSDPKKPIAEIITPDDALTVPDVQTYLKEVRGWQQQQGLGSLGGGYISRLWYRGVKKKYPSQVPGVYRSDFFDRARQLHHDGSDEDARLRLEREMIGQFRTVGAEYIRDDDFVDQYVTAQHFGMPTRLLDWSMNPLAGLYFALGEEKDAEKDGDGYVYAMDAEMLVDHDATDHKGERLHHVVKTLRHPFVRYAIELAAWHRPDPKHKGYILPVLPDVIPGRIARQGSCFTFHMHEAKPIEVKSMKSFRVPANEKNKVREELHLLNINQFTIYLTLDRLSQEIRSKWRVN